VNDAIDLRCGLYQDVLANVECDLNCVDAPYSERTHGAYRDQEELRRRTIDYPPWTRDDVFDCVRFFAPRTRGWFVSLTDHVLAPHWEEAFAEAKRYVFAPLPCVEPGSRVRQTGDGPTNWAVQLVAARPRGLPYSKWGSLPGAYVVPPGHGRRRDKSGRIGGKALWLMRAIVRDYSREGDLVCDPCAGGATTLLAAQLEGRRAVGAEQDADAYAEAMEVITHGYGRNPKQEALAL
jgi:hypothetical protein